MLIRPEASAILIDGSNLHAALSRGGLNFSIDYKKLLDTFGGSLYKAFYFTALPPENEQSTLQPLIDYIEFNGFTVIKKPWKEFNHSQTFVCSECQHSNVLHTRKTKGNMDIEIAVIAEEIAPYIRNLYLFSGDGDFRYLIEGLQRKHGLHVTVISTLKTNPIMCADALRRQADAFIDLADMREAVEREEGSKRSRFLDGR